MAKYLTPFEDTQEIYDKIMIARGLKTNLTITILTDNKSKDIYKVNKASDLMKFRTGDDVIIVLNEKIFEKLTPEQRIILAEESLASISYNLETEKLEITKPDVSTFSLILSKYTFNTWNVLRESIKTLYTVEEEEQKEARDRAKSEKESRKNNR